MHVKVWQTAVDCSYSDIPSGRRGLVNLGQTCYLNVILQSLIHNPLIRHYFLADKHNSRQCKIEHCTCCEMDKLFTEVSQLPFSFRHLPMLTRLVADLLRRRFAIPPGLVPPYHLEDFSRAIRICSARRPRNLYRHSQSDTLNVARVDKRIVQLHRAQRLWRAASKRRQVREMWQHHDGCGSHPGHQLGAAFSEEHEGKLSRFTPPSEHAGCVPPKVSALYCPWGLTDQRSQVYSARKA